MTTPPTTTRLLRDGRPAGVAEESIDIMAGRLYLGRVMLEVKADLSLDDIKHAHPAFRIITILDPTETKPGALIAYADCRLRSWEDSMTTPTSLMLSSVVAGYETRTVKVIPPMNSIPRKGISKVPPKS